VDIDNDSDRDVLTANWHSNDVTILRNQAFDGGAPHSTRRRRRLPPARGRRGHRPTLTTTTFSLTNQATATAVGGNVGYAAATRVATFSPSAALGAGRTYLARVRGGPTGVADLAGNRLAADVT